MAAELPTESALPGLRHTTLTALTVGLLVAGGLLMTFLVVLRPVLDDSCNTTLRDSTFKTALAPVHLAAAAVLSMCLWMLSSFRQGTRLAGRPTLWALSAVWAYSLASALDHQLFGWAAMVGLVAAPTAGVLGLLALGTRVVLTQRSSREAHRKWQDHVRSTQVLLWGLLLIGLPASLGSAWLRGADFFCF